MPAKWIFRFWNFNLHFTRNVILILKLSYLKCGSSLSCSISILTLYFIASWRRSVQIYLFWYSFFSLLLPFFLFHFLIMYFFRFFEVRPCCYWSYEDSICNFWILYHLIVDSLSISASTVSCFILIRLVRFLQYLLFFELLPLCFLDFVLFSLDLVFRSLFRLLSCISRFLLTRSR